MALIPQSDIDKVIEANDLVSIAGEFCPDLKMRGGKFVACCPFHKEKTPSFQIDPNLQLWHCFGCGEGGNIVTFVEKAYDMDFVETIEFLANRANIQIAKTAGKKGFSKNERGRLMEACKLTVEFYHTQLMRVKNAGSNAARKYLGGRGFGSEIAKRWKLGYAPGRDALTRYLIDKGFKHKDLLDANLCMKGRDGKLHDRFYNRVMFPIFDIRGNAIAFGGRIMDDGQPKYLNSSENALFHKSKVLYGLNSAKANMAASGVAVVVEGYTDVISLHESGINYAVATLGTALTKHHIRMLNQHAKNKIVYLFDGDEAGQRAADRALNFIDEMDLPENYGKRAELVALTLPNNLDPAEFVEKYGAEKLLKLIDEAKPLLQYGIDRRFDKYDLSVPGNRAKAASEAVKVLAPIKDSLVAKEYAVQIAGKAGLKEEDVLSTLAKLKPVRKVDDDYKYQGAKGAQGVRGSRSAQSAQVTQSAQVLQVNAPAEFAEESAPIIVDKSSEIRNANEQELLCVIAQHPELFKAIKKEADQVHWMNQAHKNLYDYICQELAENPSSDAQKLIMRISIKNKNATNVLTSITQMHDFRGKSMDRARFLILSLKIEDIDGQILALRSVLNSGDDSAYEKIVELQKEQRALRQERAKVQI